MADNLIKTEIVTPNGVFYSKDIYMVTMPGSKGEFGVLVGHVASLVELQSGVVAIYDQSMKIIEQISISGGFVEVTENLVTMLVEEAVFLS